MVHSLLDDPRFQTCCGFDERSSAARAIYTMELKMYSKEPRVLIKWAKLFSFFPYDFFNGKRHPNIFKMQITVTTCGSLITLIPTDNTGSLITLIQTASITSSLSLEGLGVLKFILGNLFYFIFNYLFTRVFITTLLIARYSKRRWPDVLGKMAQIRSSHLNKQTSVVPSIQFSEWRKYKRP